MLLEFYKDNKPKWVNIQSMLALEQIIYTDYFDGAKKGGLCGVGMVFHIKRDHIIKLWMSAGKYTNTRYELLAL